MNIRQKLLQKENNKKILKLFNPIHNIRKNYTFYDNEEKNNDKIHEINSNTKFDIIKNKSIKKKIFSHKKNYANKTIILVDLKDINYLNSPNKEFIPRIIINNSNILKLKHSQSSINYIKYIKNDSLYKKYLNSNIKYPIINEINKKRERNIFNKRNIFERKGAYESCNELSYKMPINNKKKIINKKQKNRSVFDSFQMSSKSDIYNRILDITKFINNEINDINSMVKKPY